ncbi:MAG: hypothetical protein LBD53_08055 [Tannerella sp.]|jgi:hypothetical protein|nr:hypothetical protein [Tannerella sp.]
MKQINNETWLFLLLGVAIALKIIFLIFKIRSGDINFKKLSTAMWLILTGVVMICISMFFKYIIHISLLQRILFYVAIGLKFSGLIIIIVNKIRARCSK